MSSPSTEGGLGHNNPPSPVEIFQARIANYHSEANALGPVTEDNAQIYRDSIGLGGKLAKEIDQQRDSEKRPHLEAGRKIDATYKPLVETAETIQKKLRKTLEAYVVAREREAQKAAEEARRAEEAARQEAEAQVEEDDPFLAATASTVDVKAAEAERKAAEAAALASSRVSSAAGGFAAAGLKTIRKAKVTDWAKLAMHYLDAHDVKTALEKLANQEIRGAKGRPVEIPGVEIVEERVL